ncbi:unnamed protein product [Rotaria magnacalcarata]
MDEYDKPRSIAINDHMSEWHGKLNSNEKYAETQAYVKIINELEKRSGHNAVMIQQGALTSTPMKAMAAGVYKGYACVWFGQQVDTYPPSS